MNEIFHPIAWLIWLASAALVAMTTRNPLYITLLVTVVAATYATLRTRAPQADAWTIFLRAGLFLVLLGIPFNAFVVHAGATILFTLPENWPVIGGNITLEASLYGFANGLGLLAILLVFATFNLGMDQSRLLRLAPRAFYTVGMITTIAVTFVPQMLSTLRDIREVQRLRGHRASGLRNAGSLALPLLTTGLERAIQLAESMEARGFSNASDAAENKPYKNATRFKLAAALSVLLLGLFAASYWPNARSWAPWLVAASLIFLAFLFWQQGRRVQRTRYRRWVWRQRDTWLAATCGLVGLAWLSVWLFNKTSIIYYPYPPFSPWPTFNAWLGIGIALLIAPALLIPKPRRDETSFA